MSDFAAFAARLQQLDKQLSGEAQRELVGRVALAAKKDAMTELVKDVGGDKKMSNWKPRLSVGYEVISDHEAEVKGRPGGPWLVLDSGRFPGTKYSRKRKRQVHWGASRGKRTWARAEEVMAMETPRRVSKELHADMAKIFTGE